jgi:hypothetical protein
LSEFTSPGKSAREYVLQQGPLEFGPEPPYFDVRWHNYRKDQPAGRPAGFTELRMGL